MSQEPEWKTRKQRIDTKLRALNPKWEIIKYRDGLDTSVLQYHAVEEYPTASGPAVNSRHSGAVHYCRIRSMER